jgi:hypothetical protein
MIAKGVKMNRTDTPFAGPDFTKDGTICFGKFKGLHISALPLEFYKYLVAHYRFNLAVLTKHGRNIN